MTPAAVRARCQFRRSDWLAGCIGNRPGGSDSAARQKMAGQAIDTRLLVAVPQCHRRSEISEHGLRRMTRFAFAIVPEMLEGGLHIRMPKRLGMIRALPLAPNGDVTATTIRHLG